MNKIVKNGNIDIKLEPQRILMQNSERKRTNYNQKFYESRDGSKNINDNILEQLF